MNNYLNTFSLLHLFLLKIGFLPVGWCSGADAVLNRLNHVLPFSFRLLSPLRNETLLVLCNFVSPCLLPRGRLHYLVKMSFFPWRHCIVFVYWLLNNISLYSSEYECSSRWLSHFWSVLQLSDWHEGLPEVGCEKALQTLPVHHPRQENLQRAAAAQTHEARERKLPQGAETV